MHVVNLARDTFRWPQRACVTPHAAVGQWLRETTPSTTLQQRGMLHVYLLAARTSCRASCDGGKARRVLSGVCLSGSGDAGDRAHISATRDASHNWRSS